MYKRNCFYTTTCLDACERDIKRMCVFAKEVSGRTFMARCDGVVDFSKAMGFSTTNDLFDSPGVKTFRSAYCRRKCYYIRIDGVKYIWCEQSEVYDGIRS